MEEERVTLKVAEALQEDVGMGRARIDSATRMKLGVEVGDIIEIRGNKTTAAKVFRLKQQDEGKGIIRMDGLLRKNAGVSMGDYVEVRKAEVVPAEKVVLAPLIGKGSGIRFGTGIGAYAKKGLMNRAMSRGDLLAVPGIALMGNVVPFIVLSTNPGGIVKVTDMTEIVVKDEGVSEADLNIGGITYEDIGGLKDELQKVREMIELPLKHPELFKRLGIDPPKGVLLHGPPGTGKTLIARAVANESGASFFSIQGPEIMSKFYGESEERLREIFEKATKEAPSIIFIDEIDSIAPKRDEVKGEVERRVVAQLLTLMDGMKERENVIVIGATNRPDAIDPALRRPGRFDREIEIGVPDREGRYEILQIHTRGMPIEGDEETREKILRKLAEVTHGFVGADLAALAREAAMKALRRYLPEIDLDSAIDPEVLEKMRVKEEDFKEALKEVEPSSLREVLVEVPNVHWDDVGDLEDAKMKLKEAVELPLKEPDRFDKLGIKPPRGVLLYGPPGTGKTLLAKAVATESEANFISVKGPEIMSMWVGESERAIREIFKKAKQASPSIVFFDEIDAIAPMRGSAPGNRASEQVVNQLLTSMDGLESMEGVVVIGATNRPDIIDPALMRPGRFDRHIYIGVPDKYGRKKIFEVHTRKMPLDSVDLDALAERTEGFVGADIEALCREAAMNALRKGEEKVTAEDFEEALKEVHPSVDEEVRKYYEEVAKTLSSGVRKKKTDIGPMYYS
jgi:transitional endoplasmic reticulum ATPase